MKRKMMLAIAILWMPAMLVHGPGAVSESAAAPGNAQVRATFEWPDEDDCWRAYDNGEYAADAYQRAVIAGDEEAMWKYKTMWKLAFGGWLNHNCFLITGGFPGLEGPGGDVPDTETLD